MDRSGTQSANLTAIFAPAWVAMILDGRCSRNCDPLPSGVAMVRQTIGLIRSTVSEGLSQLVD